MPGSSAARGRRWALPPPRVSAPGTRGRQRPCAGRGGRPRPGAAAWPARPKLPAAPNSAQPPRRRPPAGAAWRTAREGVGRGRGPSAGGATGVTFEGSSEQEYLSETCRQSTRPVPRQRVALLSCACARPRTRWVAVRRGARHSAGQARNGTGVGELAGLKALVSTETFERAMVDCAVCVI